MKISAVIMAKNEEQNVSACIRSLKFCDEVVVIDDYSDDKTIKIAKKMGARVFQRNLNSDYAAQRNFGLKMVRGDWALFVDADERVSRNLAKEIIKIVKQAKFDGAFIKRDDYFCGKKLKFGETAGICLLRLGKKGKGKWKRRVHETWEIEGEIIKLNNPLIHHSHPNLEQFIKSINQYSSLHAREKQESGERSAVLKIIFYPVAKFINNWIVKLGFLDGLCGFVFAFVMSFHSFLSWSKLWLYQRKR